MLGWVGRAREVLRSLFFFCVCQGGISPDGLVSRGGGWALENLWDRRVVGSWLGWVDPRRGHSPPPPVGNRQVFYV